MKEKKRNPFQNIKVRSSEIAMQQVSDNTVVKKKRGRPARPNMKEYLIKLDIALNEQTVREAERLGTSKSFIIAQGLRMYFERKK